MSDDSAFRSLERELCDAYPDLQLFADEKGLGFRGSFPVFHETRVLSRFLIEMRFPDGPQNLPSIVEIGGRIPRRDGTRHINWDDTICAGVPEVWLIKGDRSLIGYLNGPVRNYFLGQLFVERGLAWPYGEWAHGTEGYVQAYAEMLDISDLATVKDFLAHVAHPDAPPVDAPCPCQSGNLLGDCHLDKVMELRSKIPPDIAKSALERI